MRFRFILARFVYGFITLLFFIGAIASILALLSPRSDHVDPYAEFVTTLACIIISCFSTRRWKHWTTSSSCELPKPPNVA